MNRDGVPAGEKLKRRGNRNRSANVFFIGVLWKIIGLRCKRHAMKKKE